MGACCSLRGRVSLLAGMLFGLAPALKSSTANLYAALKEGGRGTSGARHRVHAAFVVGEMALALVLLIGPGLMIRTLSACGNVDPGFDSKNVLTFAVGFPLRCGTAGPADGRALIFASSISNLHQLRAWRRPRSPGARSPWRTRTTNHSGWKASSSPKAKARCTWRSITLWSRDI